MENVQINLPNKLIDDIANYCGCNDLSNEKYFLDEIKVRTGAGKLKKFYKFSTKENNTENNFIIKVIPVMDAAIGMSEDKYHREFNFASSHLYKKINEVFKIPIILTYKNSDTKEHFIVMKDITEELDKFGPKNIPDKDTLIHIISKLGKFHSITCNNERLETDNPWLMNFDIWVKNGCKVMQAIIDNKIEDRWIDIYIKDKPELIEAFPKFMKSLNVIQQNTLKEFIYNPEIILNSVNKSLRAVCHNDLFFPNIGKDIEEWHVIDWEFIGVSPTAWDVYSLYSGIPQEELKEEEMFDVYFNALEEEGVKIDKEQWIKAYNNMEVIEILLYALRDLVPLAFDINSKVSEEHKNLIKEELKKLIEKAEATKINLN